MSRLSAKQIAERRRAIEAEEAKAPEQWFWLSFIHDNGQSVSVVRGRGILSATREAWRLGCNPGGEVFAIPIGEAKFIATVDRERLLSLEEAVAIRSLASPR
jgi:hypothetical protein